MIESLLLIDLRQKVRKLEKQVKDLKARTRILEKDLTNSLEIPDNTDLTNRWLINVDTLETHKVLNQDGSQLTLSNCKGGLVHITMAKKLLRLCF